MLGWLRDTLLFGGKPRSGSWSRVRREHLSREPMCIACGRDKSLEVHHVQPFHENPELELDSQNLVSLCAEPCHFVFGHLLHWSASNPYVRDDAQAYRKRLKNERGI
jgi:5-methylcytosine-specific restriction endonuclease McrA